MQTVATMAERLDMTAEEALERLQYMYYDVPSTDVPISDDICDVLIDVDDDPKVAKQVREQKDEERAKEEAAVAKKKAAAEKKKAAAARKGANAIINLSQQRSGAGRSTSQGDAVLIRPTVAKAPENKNA